MRPNDRFTHNRLDAYRVSVKLVDLGVQLADLIPFGYRKLADQLLRATSAVPLLIAEGANRGTKAQKKQRFIEARGEVGEAAAAVEVIEVLRFISESQSDEFQDLAARLAALLTGLIKKFGGR